MVKWSEVLWKYGLFWTVENSMILPITSYSGDLGTSILNNYFYLPYSDDMSNEAYGFG